MPIELCLPPASRSAGHTPKMRAGGERASNVASADEHPRPRPMEERRTAGVSRNLPLWVHLPRETLSS
jgi:hypothetical protein